MNRKQLWVEVRYRLVVLGLAAVVIGSMSLALRPSVHVGNPPPYQPHALQPYEAHLIAWKPQSSEIAGWSRNNTFVNCPSLVVWVKTGGRTGYISAGPVAAGQSASWSGWVRDVHGNSVLMTTTPILSPNCQ